MSKHVMMNGVETNEHDPLRAVWYAAGCGYWTDDWDKLSAFGSGIPCCPTCGCPGYYAEFQRWIDGAKKYEEEGHPRYQEFLMEYKEKCTGRGFDYIAAYQDWKERN